MKYLVSLSGGKDSTACLLWALDNLPKEDIVPYFIDTKWEHHSVYEYLDYLEKKLNITIVRIESEGMEALCERKKFMPNRMMRFCTHELKIIPSQKWLYDTYLSKGIDFINIVGVRREESKSRANEESFKIVDMKMKGIKEKFKIKTLQPIVYWDTQKVFNYITKEHKLEVNALYKKGFTRVGVLPLYFCKKSGSFDVRATI